MIENKDANLLISRYEIDADDFHNYIEDMVNHGVNVFFMSLKMSQMNPVWDANKKSIVDLETNMDYQRTKTLVDGYKKYNYPLVICFSGGINAIMSHLKKAGLKITDEQGKAVFKSWVESIFIFFEKIGYKRADLIALLIDEIFEERTKMAAEIYPVFKIIAPNVRLMQTIGYYSDLEDIKAVEPYVDIFQLHVLNKKGERYLLRDEIVEFLKGKNKKIWIYNNSISKKATDCLYIRLQPWIVWQYNLDGVGFFSYSRFVGDPWDDRDFRDLFKTKKQTGFYDRLVVYPGNNGPVTTRRWESFRDGLEDYRCLSLLESTIKEAEASGIDTDVAHMLLTEIAKNVSNITGLSSVNAYRMKLIAETQKLRFLMGK
jgi:hypothetical protein